LGSQSALLDDQREPLGQVIAAAIGRWFAARRHLAARNLTAH
jgi:hypothetical protein